MKRDEPPKVFDVSRNASGPSPTSKPIIVGHHPTMPDPMLHHNPLVSTPAAQSQPTETVKITLNDSPPVITPGATIHPAPAVNATPEPSPRAEMPAVGAPAQITAAESPAELSAQAAAAIVHQPLPAVQPAEDLRVHLPAGDAAHGGSKVIWIALVLTIAVIGIAAYLFTK